MDKSEFGGFFSNSAIFLEVVVKGRERERETLEIPSNVLPYNRTILRSDHHRVTETAVTGDI